MAQAKVGAGIEVPSQKAYQIGCRVRSRKGAIGNCRGFQKLSQNEWKIVILKKILVNFDIIFVKFFPNRKPNILANINNYTFSWFCWRRPKLAKFYEYCPNASVLFQKVVTHFQRNAHCYSQANAKSEIRPFEIVR